MKLPILLTLIIACVVLPSCKRSGSSVGGHHYDTVTFDLTKSPPALAKPIPTVWLDTNLEVDGLFGGGNVKSGKPYHIRIDYTDNASLFSSLEVNKVKVVYDDGKVEPGTEGLTLPFRIQAREYEMVNSINGGRTVKAKVNLLSGTLRDIITQDESLTLKMEGFFITKDGNKSPFAIDDHYTVRFDKGIKPLGDM